MKKELQFYFMNKIAALFKILNYILSIILEKNNIYDI